MIRHCLNCDGKSYDDYCFKCSTKMFSKNSVSSRPVKITYRSLLKERSLEKKKEAVIPKRKNYWRGIVAEFEQAARSAERNM